MKYSKLIAGLSLATPLLASAAFADDVKMEPDIWMPKEIVKKDMFFANPENDDFKFYGKKVKEYVKDEILSGQEIFNLEGILDQTISEIDGHIKDFDMNAVEARAEYMNFLDDRKKDLETLKGYKESCREWMKSEIYDGGFVFYGLPQIAIGKTHDLADMLQTDFYKDRFNIDTEDFKIERPDIAFPAKTKIPHNLGLALSLLIPTFTYFGGRLLRSEPPGIGSGVSAGYAILPVMTGLYAMHPAVFPVFMAAPVVLEIVNTLDKVCDVITLPKKNPAASPSARAKPTPNPKTGSFMEEQPEKKPNRLLEVSDPWDEEPEDVTDLIDFKLKRKIE